MKCTIGRSKKKALIKLQGHSRSHIQKKSQYIANKK